jgi:WD40 repeat protein
VIRARLDYEGNYQIDVGDGLPQMAKCYDRSANYSVGEIVQAEWHPPAATWILPTRAPISVNAPDELLIDGPDGVLDPPSVGWSVSASGFGNQFTASGEASTLSSSSRKRIAWHPSGRAVAIGYGDTIEAWEWLPGIGFGRKYLPVYMAEADAAAASYLGDAAFTYPQVSASGGNYAFSPDGNYFAIAGANTGTADISGVTRDIPVMCMRFNLRSGFDPVHPIYPYENLTGLGQAYDVAWTPDSAHIGIGCEQTPFVKAWNFTASAGGAFSTAETDPASLPAAKVMRLAWNPAGTFIAVGMDVSVTPPAVKAWPWSSGFGTAVTAPSTTLQDQVGTLSWHPAGTHVVVIAYDNDDDTFNGVHAYEFDDTGGGSWGNMIEVDSPLTFTDDAAFGAAFNSDGSLIALLGQDSGGDPVAALARHPGRAGHRHPALGHLP